MSGKMCNGLVDLTAGKIKNSKAYCEGVNYRASGPEIDVPLTNNPHVAPSEAYRSWEMGWLVADSFSPSPYGNKISCCAATGPIPV